MTVMKKLLGFVIIENVDGVVKKTIEGGMVVPDCYESTPEFVQAALEQGYDIVEFEIYAEDDLAPEVYEKGQSIMAVVDLAMNIGLDTGVVPNLMRGVEVTDLL